MRKKEWKSCFWHSFNTCSSPNTFVMPLGARLTDVERGQVDVLAGQGLSNRAIATTIGRSPTVVDNYRKDPVGYGAKNRGGRPRKLTIRDERMIARTVSNKRVTTALLKSDLRLSVSNSTVLRSIHRNAHLTRQKMKSAPRLLPRHIADRMTFARNHFNTDWTKVSKSKFLFS